MIDPAWSGARRVLAVRLDNLGDVLVTTPAIAALATALPGAEITLLASPVGAQVGRLNRHITDVTVHEAPWVDPWLCLPQDTSRELAMVERLREGRFDAAVIFTSFRQSPLPAAYLCYLAGIPLRLAASVDGPGSLLTTRHKHPERPMHEVERGLDLVAAIGVPPAGLGLVLDVPEPARREAARLRQSWTGSSTPDPRRPLVVVSPGCSMPARTYPAERFVEVVEALVTELDATVVLTGSASEQELTAGIRGRVAAERRPRVHDLAGGLAFPELCAVVEGADLVVTNNTGPMHVAAATGTPIVALFALTNPPAQWGPWRVPHRLLNHDVPCRICYSRVCPYGQECIATVTAGEVLAAARELGVGPTGAHALAGAGAAAGGQP